MTSDPILAAIEGQISAERGLRARLRAAPTRIRTFAVAAVWVAVPVYAWLTGLRVDVGVYPKTRLFTQIAFIGVAAAITLLMSMRPLHRPPLRRWFFWGGLLLCLGLAVALFALPVAHLDHPESLHGVGADFFRRALACFLVGMTWSSIPFATLLLFSRHIASFLPMFALSSMCGLAGLVIHCPLVAREHIFAGHTAVVLTAFVLSLAATWIRRR